MNAPWGLAWAPEGFGKFSGDLLVGNFGDGRINAYEPQSGGGFLHRGVVRGKNSNIIEIDGLWAIAFGNDARRGTQHVALLHGRPRRRGARSVRKDRRVDS